MGKKQEEEFVQVKCQEYYKLENELRIKFTELLKKNGFLQKESCTNEEAFKRVSLLLDIINRFFVENVPSNYLNNRKDHFDFYKIWKKFNRDIVHIDKQLRVPNMVKYRDSDGDIRERKDYEVYAFEFDSIEGISRRTLNAYNEFSPIYSRLAKKEAILGQGIQGEERLYNRLRIIGDKIRIIQNARYVIEDDFSVEHDMIVISSYGIFSIEIKNWGRNSHINEKGYLVSENGKTINVIEQSMRHVHNLERLIQKELYHEAKVYPLIVWVNEKSAIKNDFKYVTVCNYNDVEFELFNSRKYKPIYTEKDVDAIYKKLVELKLPIKKYSLDIDSKSLISSVPKFIAGLNWLPEMIDFEKKIKEAKLEPGTLETIATIIGAGIIAFFSNLH